MEPNSIPFATLPGDTRKVLHMTCPKYITCRSDCRSECAPKTLEELSDRILKHLGIVALATYQSPWKIGLLEAMSHG
jgi:hypothetical protein